jgi:hypothetical protein
MQHGAQSRSHHAISKNGMVSMSARVKPVSLAMRFASWRITDGSKFVFFDQAKIAHLDALIVFEREVQQFLFADVAQAGEQH